MIQCNICGNFYKRIDSVHLPSKHNITVNEYLIMFPNSEVVSQQSIEEYSNAQKTYAKSNPDKIQERAKKAKTTITLEQQQKTLNAELIRIRQSESNKILEIL